MFSESVSKEFNSPPLPEQLLASLVEVVCGI